MRKCVASAALVLIMLGALRGMADTYGPDAWGQTWTYEILNGTSVRITGVADKTLPYDAANFPWTFTNGGTTYTVTQIGANACLQWYALTGDLVMPPTVQELGNYAFYECANLVSVTFSEGIKKMGSHLFSMGCKTQEKPFSLIIPASLDSLDRQMFQWGGCNIASAWFKGKPDVTSGTQPYTAIAVYNTLYASPSLLKTVLIGKNTDAITTANKGLFVHKCGSVLVA